MSADYGRIWSDAFQQEGLRLIHTEVGDGRGESIQEQVIHATAAAADKLYKCRIPRYLQPDTRVLEIGCGPGFNLRALNGSGFSVQGVDPCNDLIIYGFQNVVKNTDIWLHHGFFQHLAFPARYDLIFELIVFQHLRKSEVQEIFNKVPSNLLEDGRFVFQMLHCDSPRVRPWDGDEDERPVPCMRGYSTGEVNSMLTEAGMTMVKRWFVSEDWFMVEAKCA